MVFGREETYANPIGAPTDNEISSHVRFPDNDTRVICIACDCRLLDYLDRGRVAIPCNSARGTDLPGRRNESGITRYLGTVRSSSRRSGRPTAANCLVAMVWSWHRD